MEAIESQLGMQLRARCRLIEGILRVPGETRSLGTSIQRRNDGLIP